MKRFNLEIKEGNIVILGGQAPRKIEKTWMFQVESDQIEISPRPSGGLGLKRYGTFSGKVKYTVELDRNGMYYLGRERCYYLTTEKEEINKIIRKLVPRARIRDMNSGEILPIYSFASTITEAYFPEGTTDYITDGISVDGVGGGGEIKEGSFSIQLLRRLRNTWVDTHVQEVVLWPECEPDSLRKALERALEDPLFIK